MRRGFVGLLCCCVAILPAGAGSSNEQLSLTRDRSGDLLATLHTTRSRSSVCSEPRVSGWFFTGKSDSGGFSVSSVRSIRGQGCGTARRPRRRSAARRRANS